MKIDIDPKKDLFVWGPIDGRLIYPDFFDIAFLRFQKYFRNFSWPDILGLYDHGKMSYVLDPNDLAVRGLRVFKHFVLTDHNLKKYYQEWKRIIKELIAIQKQILAGLNKLSDEELPGLYRIWSEKYFEFWRVGLIPELANYGAEPWLRDLLTKEVPSSAFIQVFERLTAPEQLSFYQKAELELLRLYKYKNKPKLLNKELKKHQAKYPWILNSYKETRTLTVEHFRKELFAKPQPYVTKRLKELELWSSGVNRSRRETVKRFKIPPKLVKIGNRIAFCVSWQDLRKFYIFLANHYIDIFLKEIARRKKLDFDDLHWYNHFEIKRLLEKNKALPIKEVGSRKQHLAVWYSEEANSLKFISGRVAERIIKQYSKKKVSNQKEITGVVVSRGKKVRAKVRIIDTISKLKKMKEGEILVSPMTAPDYITAIRKAVAIVTDTGGITSHAAIVSRELGIPCIVGTKIATKVLKDGDLVEVDANKGIVRKVDR